MLSAIVRSFIVVSLSKIKIAGITGQKEKMMGKWEYSWVKLGLNEQNYVALLSDMYHKRELSHAKIADLLNIHVETIRRHCKRYKIQSRTISEATRIAECKKANLTDAQKEMLDGILLADGHLDGRSQVSARITYGCKFIETLNDLSNGFDQLHFSDPWRSKINNWHFKSSFYTDLREHWYRWYSKSKKIVPKDVKLTRLSCYWWFVGDGYQVDYGLQFCTDDFDDNSKMILCEELLKLGFNAKVTPSSGRIRVQGKSAPRFLFWTRPLATSQYQYKWGNHRKQSKEY